LPPSLIRAVKAGALTVMYMVGLIFRPQ